MAGFTPINAPVQQVASTAITFNLPISMKGSHAPDLQQRSVSSRSSSLDISRIAASQAPREVKSRKRASQGKQRVGTTSNDGVSRRRKSSVLSNSMSVIKPVTDRPTETGKASRAKRTVNDTKHQVKSKLARQAIQLDTVVQSDQTVTGASVPVYALPTTMDSVQSRSLLTSVETFKHAPHQGHAVYNAPSISDDMEGVTFAQPWLTNVEIKHEWESRENHTFIEHGDDFDETMDELLLEAETQLPALPGLFASPGIANHNSTVHQPNGQSQPQTPPPTDENFLATSSSDNEDFVAVGEQAEATAPPRDRRLNWRHVALNEAYDSALLSSSERQLLSSLDNPTNSPKPLVRQPFPPRIPDRSPVFGATNKTVLRTCFRVGEALNVGCRAARANQAVLLELFARVVESWSGAAPTSPKKQHFVFHDLYHHNPPYLEGTLDLSMCRSSLWESDSKPFLTPEKGSQRMCRVVGSMRREDGKWKLNVCSLWEAGWEDVEAVAGIYGKDQQGGEFFG